MEYESLMDAKNVTVDTFSHAPSAQRENANTIFTSGKLNKLDKLVDTVKDLKSNNTKYYKSNTVTASDKQGNLKSNPETVTHTSNVILQQMFLSFWTIPVLPLPTNPGIVAIRLTPQTLLTPATKEIITDVASDGTWTHMNPRKVSRTNVN